jgi:hypothetical protein
LSDAWYLSLCICYLLPTTTLSRPEGIPHDRLQPSGIINISSDISVSSIAAHPGRHAGLETSLREAALGMRRYPRLVMVKEIRRQNRLEKETGRRKVR